MFLTGCSGPDQNQVTLFNGVSFKLAQNEKVVDLRPTDRNYFVSFFEQTGIQIPLFRRIESSTHSIFIGLPINTSFDALFQMQNKDVEALLFSSSDSATFLHRQQMIDSSYVIEHVRALNQNLVYLIVVSNQVQIAQDLLSADALNARFVSP